MLSRKAYDIAEKHISDMDGYTAPDSITHEKAQHPIVCTFETDPVTKELARFSELERFNGPAGMFSLADAVPSRPAI